MALDVIKLEYKNHFSSDGSAASLLTIERVNNLTRSFMTLAPRQSHFGEMSIDIVIM